MILGHYRDVHIGAEGGDRRMLAKYCETVRRAIAVQGPSGSSHQLLQGGQAMDDATQIKHAGAAGNSSKIRARQQAVSP